MTLGAQPSGVFDADQAATLARADHQHWWFQQKARLVNAAVRRAVQQPPQRWIDVGAGAGGVTHLLGDGADVLAAEGSAELVAACRARGVTAIQASVDAVPVDDRSADVVSLLDVIEHLPDPVAALREARRIVASDGVVVVTVPAHRWLWSSADEALGHVMRYTRADVRAQLNAGGLRPITCSHVFSWLAPPILVRRRFGRSDDVDRRLGVDADGRAVAAIARGLTTVELALVRHVSLPLGSSILALATPR